MTPSAAGWSLDADRRLLERRLPGLTAALERHALDELEQPGGPGLELFRSAGGPALLVPAEHKGAGTGAREAVRVQRALGAVSPSLAVATTMHHFSVATLGEMAAGSGSGLEWVVLQAIARNRLLVASGFAEGRTGQHVLRPTLAAVRADDGGLVVNGSKKPCSLTWSMDLLTASACVRESGRPDRVAVVMIPAGTPGIGRRRFWGSRILAGAESDEITLTDVHVPERLVLFPDHLDVARDPQQARGFIWFEALIAASYLGIASGLAARVIEGGRATPADRVDLAVELEGARYALLHLAAMLEDREDGHGEGPARLGDALLVRYAVQRAVMRAVAAAAELCGGMSFISDGDVAYRLAAARALAFHPPSYSSAVASLDEYLGGAEFVLS